MEGYDLRETSANWPANQNGPVSIPTVWRVPGLSQRVKTAIEEGLLFGVKWGVALVMLGSIILFAVGDYFQVRQAAAQGAQAFQVIQQARQAQQSQGK